MPSRLIVLQDLHVSFSVFHGLSFILLFNVMHPCAFLPLFFFFFSVTLSLGQVTFSGDPDLLFCASPFRKKPLFLKG